MVKIHQYEVFLISLDPLLGSEVQKTLPCVVVSPDEMNEFSKTLIVIPITSKVMSYPWRVPCLIDNRSASMATDQIKVVDRASIALKIGKLSKGEIIVLKDALHKMLID
ncbi:type II toxin-antitoxin system PemK/MazF family toxin [Pedobacter petrophilus]|nr:type II toxin-antitoxin system PemK/MazF family toxin [Pedobacter petrophilus]